MSFLGLFGDEKQDNDKASWRHNDTNFWGNVLDRGYQGALIGTAALPFAGTIAGGIGGLVAGAAETVFGNLFGDDIDPATQTLRDQKNKTGPTLEEQQQLAQDDVTRARLFGDMDDVKAAQAKANADALSPRPKAPAMDSVDALMEQAKAERERQMDLYIQGKGPKPGDLPSWRELEGHLHNKH